jgi:hypothetical protein
MTPLRRVFSACCSAGPLRQRDEGLLDERDGRAATIPAGMGTIPSIARQPSRITARTRLTGPAQARKTLVLHNS